MADNQISADTSGDGDDTPIDDRTSGPHATLREKKRLHAQLVARVKVKRVDQEIEDLERELADTTGTFHAAVNGVPYISARKRPLSRSAETPIPQRTRTTHASRSNTPPEYHARNLRELNECESAWETWFEDDNKSEEFPTERSRITHIATYLRGKALSTWRMTPHRETITEWDDFMEVLKGALQNLDNRKVTASAALKIVRQKEGQSVQDLLAFIEKLERDLPYQQDEVAKGHVLYDALLPALQVQVLRDIKRIDSRDQVFAAAQRHEELLASEKRIKEAGAPRTSSRPSAPRAPPSMGLSRPDFKGGAAKSPEKRDFRRDPCFNCGQHGHLARFCPQRRKEAKN